MVCCGSRPSDWPKVLETARAGSGIVPAFGVHPWHAGSLEEGWESLLASFLDSAPSAVGEIGLDGLRGGDGQEGVFASQLKIAERRRAPAIVHCVRSWGKLLEMLRGGSRGPVLLHAYGGGPEMIEPFARAGAYFSFGPTALGRPRARAALFAAPAGRILLESDAPYGGEPASIAALAREAAELRGEGPEAFAAEVYANSLRLFGSLLPAP
jgi:TatD DNase family protein